MTNNILLNQIIKTLIIILLSSLIYIILKTILKKIFTSRISRLDKKKSKTLMSLSNNILKYLMVIIAILLILDVFGIDTKTIIASLGVVGLVIGLAIQDTIKDFISGFTILVENQYGVGDYVTINDFNGYIISLGLKTTKIKSYTGEVKFIANRMITEVVNHSLDYSLAIVDISIPFEQNIDKALKVLNNMCLDLNDKIDGLTDTIKVLGVEEFADSGIVIRITAKTEPMKHFQVKRELLKNIKEVFDKNKIEIPYDHVVISNE